MKNKKIVVSDTTPLIVLEKITSGFDFVQKIYQKILIPKQVLEELTRKPLYDWQPWINKGFIKVIEPVNLDKFTADQNLDDGEKYAIALAKKENLPILIHEKKGRRVAKELNLEVTGISGEILRAYKNRIIEKTEALYLITQLYSASQISQTLYNQAILDINRI